MSDQVAVLESIRDVLSGKVSAQPAEAPAVTDEDEAEILDLTNLVNDDGSITDLTDIDEGAEESLQETAEEIAQTAPEINDVAKEATKNEPIEEDEMAKVSTTAGNDVLDEIDRLLADETSGGFDKISEEAEESIDEMIDPIEHLDSISDETLELELAEETKPKETEVKTATLAETEFEPIENIITETTDNEEIMTETDSQLDDSLLSDASADKAKSAIADLLKVTGQNKAAHTPTTPAPSFRNGDTLEDLVMESLKPMLAKWLDENLNSLVEEIVQKEISRIIPK